MAYHIISPRLNAQPLSETSTTKKHHLGEIVEAYDETLGVGTFIYTQASASLTQYDAVFIKGTHKAAQLTIDNAKLANELGFAQLAAAKDAYLWVQQTGRPLIRLGADCDKDLGLYATATPGVLDDATVSAYIQGVVCTTSVTGAVTAATCVASFPTVNRRDDSVT